MKPWENFVKGPVAGLGLIVLGFGWFILVLVIIGLAVLFIGWVLKGFAGR